jgi:peptidoglycan-associated lipoprotein
MKLILSGVLALGLFFTGCSSKQDVAVESNKAEKKVQNTKTKANNNLEKQKGQISEQIMAEGEKHNSIYLVHSVYFDFDKYNIKNSMKDIANENITHVKNHLSNDSNAVVTLEGNCDNVGTDEYNYALGLKRAKSVKDNLTKAGIDSSNIIIKSLGESSPVCKEDTTNCRSKNRRVDYIINK